MRAIMKSEKPVPQKIRNYICTHFIISTINSKSKTCNSGWKKYRITSDPGVSNIFYAGVYMSHEKKNLAASSFEILPRFTLKEH